AGAPPGCGRSGHGARAPGGCALASLPPSLLDLEVEDGGVAPAALEGVEGAVLGVLDVDDDVAVVEQHPARVPLALAAQRLAAALLQERLLDAIDDRGDLALGVSAADEEHIGDDHELGDVEADHLLGELVSGGLSGDACEIEGFIGDAHAVIFSRRGWSSRCSGVMGRAPAVAAGPRTPVSSRTTRAMRAIAMSAQTSSTRAGPAERSGRCRTLPSKRGAGRGSGASVTESSPSSTPSWSRAIVAIDVSSAGAVGASAPAGAALAPSSLSSMMRARRPNLRSIGTGSSAPGGATAPRTPGMPVAAPE